jgi:hypothetical protein
VRKSCGAISSRSSAPGRKGKRASESPVNRPSNLRTIPRARKTDNRVRSATEARDIEAWAPLTAGVASGYVMRPAAGPYPNGVTTANQRFASGALDPTAVEAVEAAHLWVGIRELARQRAQVSGGAY